MLMTEQARYASAFRAEPANQKRGIDKDPFHFGLEFSMMMKDQRRTARFSGGLPREPTDETEPDFRARKCP